MQRTQLVKPWPEQNKTDVILSYFSELNPKFLDSQTSKISEINTIGILYLTPNTSTK